jgi:hypothetical protein
MNKYRQAIAEIARSQDTLRAVDCDIAKRLLAKVVGDVGELHVLAELAERGLGSSSRRGPMAPFDICLDTDGLRIEVKTSLLKNEALYSEDIRFYGWTVTSRTQKGGCKFDILVGVALHEPPRTAEFYIFTQQELLRLKEVRIPRFTSVKKKIHLFESEEAYKCARSQKRDFVCDYEGHINLHRNEFLSRWDKLRMTST